MSYCGINPTDREAFDSRMTDAEQGAYVARVQSTMGDTLARLAPSLPARERAADTRTLRLEPEPGSS